MHQKHVENLKSQLKDYKVDPFEESSAICLSTGLWQPISLIRNNHYESEYEFEIEFKIVVLT